MVCEQRSLHLYASWRSKNNLCGQRFEFVSYRVSTERVLFEGVRNLEYAVVERIGVQSNGFSDGGLADLIEVAVWIRVFVLWDGVRLFVCHRVVVTIDCGIDAYSEVSLEHVTFK
jgi:hypothetical protein